MEEDTVELFDYLRVIWKRKILIIVVILVCLGIGVGVGVKNSTSKSPVTLYHAEEVVKIGKKLNLAPFTGVSSSVGYIESPENLVTIIPLRYGFNFKDDSRYHLEVKQIGSLGMLRIILNGNDRGVERGLKEIVDKLIDEHHVLAESSIIAYKNLIKKLEKDAETLEGEVVRIAAGVKEMREKEAEYLINIDSVREEEQIGGDRSAFLNMLYLKTLDKERDLSSSQSNLRNIQTQLLTHRITLGNLKEYKTERFGRSKTSATEPKKEEWAYNAIAVGGVAGLIMSLFIAFFLEYLVEAGSRRKGK